MAEGFEDLAGCRLFFSDGRIMTDQLSRSDPRRHGALMYRID